MDSKAFVAALDQIADKIKTCSYGQFSLYVTHLNITILTPLFETEVVTAEDLNDSLEYIGNILKLTELIGDKKVDGLSVDEYHKKLIKGTNHVFTSAKDFHDRVYALFSCLYNYSKELQSIEQHAGDTPM